MLLLFHLFFAEVSFFLSVSVSLHCYVFVVTPFFIPSIILPTSNLLKSIRRPFSSGCGISLPCSLIRHNANLLLSFVPSLQSGCTVVTLFVVILPTILEMCLVCCPCRHVVMHNLLNFGTVFAFLLYGDPLELAHFQSKTRDKIKMYIYWFVC